MDKIKKIDRFVLEILGSLIAMAVIAFPFLWAWNYAVVGMFPVSQFTWLESFCFLFLLRVLLRSGK